MDEDEFEELALALILAFFLFSMRRGAGLSESAVLEDDELMAIYAEAEAQARESIGNVAAEIYGGGTLSGEADLPAETIAERRENRVALWAGTALFLYGMGQLYNPSDPYLVWQVGPTEHCEDCLRLDGQIHRASEWQASGWSPQSRALACRGYRCQCGLYPASGPSSGSF